MAHKKGQGSSRNGRDSNPQYRGIKLYGGEFAKAGAIIVRQCGTKFKPGYLVGRGNDDTLYATAPGHVRFRGRFVDLIPQDPNTPRLTVVDRTVNKKEGQLSRPASFPGGRDERSDLDAHFLSCGLIQA